MKLRKHHATAIFTFLSELELPADLEFAGSAITSPGMMQQQDEDEDKATYTKSFASQREHLDWHS